MKILAVASGGGHWKELLRLMPAFEGHEIIFMSTNPAFGETVKSHAFYTLPEFSRWNKIKAMLACKKISEQIKVIKPDIIITTGAGPGLITLLSGKLNGIRTIWIESLCHAEKISMSGKFASLFADKVYTQWPHLSNRKIIYAGNILI